MARRILIVIVVLLAGIGTLAYPTISNRLAEKNGSAAIQAYDEAVRDLEQAELDAAWKDAEEYNQNLTGQPVRDPFVENSGMAMPETYWQVLNVGGIMGYVDIPRIGVHLPIYHGTSEDVLQKGVGHLEGSTLPIGGLSRQTVITGHTGLSHAKLFTDLLELEEGDLFYFQVLGRTLAYKVDQIKVVLPPDAPADLQRVSDKDYATLLTCTPYSVNSHRLLIRGERIDYDPEIRDAIVPVQGSTIDGMVRNAAVITSAVMLTLIIAVVVFRRRRENRDEAAPRYGNGYLAPRVSASAARRAW